MNTLEKNISLSGVFYVNQATSGFGREKKIFQFLLAKSTGQTDHIEKFKTRNNEQQEIRNKKANE
jgi:hypothetical protein